MTKPSWQDFATHDESIVQELWDGVVGAWAPCLGPTGSRLHDHSRRANWGTLTNMDNATDWVVSDGQYALDFDGINDSVNTDLKTDFTDFTIAGWYRSTGAGLGNFERIADNVYSVTNTGTNTGFALCRSSILLNTWGCYLVANGVVPTPIVVTLSDGNWHLLVATRKGTTLTVYGDGGAVSSSGTVSSAAFTNQPLKIGYSSIAANHNAFLGQIGDVSYWNRALTANEVQQLYQLGRGGMYQRRRRRAIYLPQAGFQSAWARGSNVLLGFSQP